MTIAAALGAAWVAVVLLVTRRGVELYGPGLGVPMVPFLVFAVELVSGRSFADLARAWDQLSGLGRFALGLVIVALAIVVIAGGVGLALQLLL